MELTALCERSGGWWAVRVPEIDGLYTQARRLDQVEFMVLDAASMADEQPPEGFTVTVVPQRDAKTRETVAGAKQARGRLPAGEASPAALKRAVAHRGSVVSRRMSSGRGSPSSSRTRRPTPESS